MVASHESRDVNIPTTVGGQISFHAITSLVEGMPVASATCIVTATAWQNDTHPLVTFDNTDGNRLSCSEGLTGIIIQLPPP